jgi:hypothetical protein
MMKKFLSILVLISFASCQQKETVDALVINAKIYTVNSGFDKAEAFAIKDGKFLEVGSTKDIQKKIFQKTLLMLMGKLLSQDLLMPIVIF